MSTPLLIGLALLLLALTAFWAVARARRIREAAREREQQALLAMRGGAPLRLDGDTVFDPAGLPSRMPERRGIEVSEHDEVVDLEALLAGEPQGVARRARATLEEPTNIMLEGDTLPPLGVAPAAAAAAPGALHAAAAATMPAPAAAAPVSAAARAGTDRPAPPIAATPIAPMPIAHASAAVHAPATGERAPMAAGGAPIRQDRGELPMRELALAWFEARGYRSAPASAAVRPIEQVLRHRHDPARAYAFVVESSRLTAERVQQLRAQARSIGLLRVLIVAEGGADEGAATRSRGVRVMDRDSLAAEFDQLDFSVAAKIIALARKRSGGSVALA